MLELQSLIEKHMEFYAELYGDIVKPKFHHAGHIARDLFKIGVALSCFPLERKHKVIKSLIVYAFRNVEMTGVKDYVNYSVQQFIENRFQFRKYWIENPKTRIVEGRLYNVSFHAHTPASEMRRDDVVLAIIDDDHHVLVGGIDCFFEADGEIVAQIASFQASQRGLYTEWVTSEPVTEFVPLADIRANLVWARRNSSIIRVMLPPSMSA